MHKWSAVGAPHYSQTQESEEEEKNQYILRRSLSRVTSGNVLTADFSGKLDYLLLPHYLVSLLPFLTGLLYYVWQGLVFLYCCTCSSSVALSSFPRNNGSVLHVPSGVHTTVPECVCHCSGLHSPGQNTTQPWFVLLSGCWTHNKHEACIKR